VRATTFQHSLNKSNGTRKVPQSALYEIRATQSKGLGVFAVCDIPSGTRITGENPILTALREPGIIDPVTIYESFEILTPAQQLVYLQLYAAPKQTEYALQCMDDDLPRELRDHVAKVTSIFESNAFRMGSEGRQNDQEVHKAGIFAIAARFNHSCTPNLAQTWNQSMGMLTMHSIRKIEAGEELCEGYVSLTENRSTRQTRLGGYGFECTCEACDDQSEAGKAREVRREKIRRLEEDLTFFTDQTEGTGSRTEGPLSNAIVKGQEDALSVVEQLEVLLQEEGLVGHDLLRWYAFAVFLEKKMLTLSMKVRLCGLE
jgi:hypothetical protein